MPITWDNPLSYEITPRSGPMRRVATLADVRTAMVHDLPPGSTKTPHWLRAGMLLVAAAEDGSLHDVRHATDALVDALDAEGWMSNVPVGAD